MKRLIRKALASIVAASLIMTLLPAAIYADGEEMSDTMAEQPAAVESEDQVSDETEDLLEDIDLTFEEPDINDETEEVTEEAEISDVFVETEEEAEEIEEISETGEEDLLSAAETDVEEITEEPQEEDYDEVPPTGGYVDAGYLFGTSEFEGEGEAPLSEEVLNGASSAPAAFSLIDLNPYFPELLSHGFKWYGGDYVTSVKNQGSYDLCWAFSGVAACESSLLVRKQESSPSSIDLSELQVAYYTQNRNSSSQPVGCEGDTASPKNSFGTVGGNEYDLISSVTRRVGFVNESACNYSQLSSGLSSSLTNGSLAKTSFRYYIRNVDVVLGSDIEKIKNLVLQNGGAACSVYFKDYNYYNKSTNAMYCYDSSIKHSHAGLIVGWDDQYPKSNFKTQPSSNGAWLIKNSWGTSSNKGGYYWLSYEDKPFRSANVFSFQCVAPSQSPAKIYQHDGGIYNGSEYFTGTAYMANVFKSASNESLTEVSFYTKEDELDYTVKIYTDVAGTPTNGILASSATTSGHCTYAGYHTVTLKTPVDLIKNDRFSVVIKLSDPQGRHVSMMYERPGQSGDTKNCSVKSEAGESYYSSNGISWKDRSVSDSGNYRIKAFTNSKPLVTKRLAGTDRYETMALIAQQAFPNGASEVILVTGSKFPDALAASALAGAKKCPLLITRLDSLNDPVKFLLATSWNKSVKKVTFIGQGFSSSVVSSLKNSCGVTSIDSTTFAGEDRYDTACRICEYGLNNGYFSTSTCIVATGAKAADALSMSPWAYYYKMPILLVNSKGQITSKTRTLLRRFSKAIAVGGTNVVPNSVLNGNVSQVIRLSGATRYETSVCIAEYFVPASDGSDGRPAHNQHFVDQITFAPGADKNFPDALVGAMLAGGTNCYSKPGPIILVSANGVDPLATQFISRYRPSAGDPLCAYFLGAVTQSVENTIKNQLTSLT